jgi:hypothetical protein
MNKFQWMCFSLAIAFPFCSLYLLSQTASAQKHLVTIDSLKQLAPPSNPRGDSIPRGGQRNPAPRNPRGPGRPGGGRLHNEILDQIQREIPFRVRGMNVCAIAPNLPIHNGDNVIWSDRPLFIWQGVVQEIAVLIPDSETALWTKKVNSSDRTASYDGPPLEPGRLYEGRLYVSENDYSTQNIRIMAANERAVITAELNALEAQLKSQGATPEEIVLERANYFVKRRLFSDALREIYSFQNPSPELTKLSQDISRFLCNTPN